MKDGLAIPRGKFLSLGRWRCLFYRATNSATCLLGAVLFLAGCEQSGPVEPGKDSSASDKQTLPRPRLLSEIDPAEFDTADLQERPRPIWIKSGSKGKKRDQSAKPKVNAAKTALLARSIVAEELGRDGAVELQPHGLLVHPGEVLPTRVDFDVKGKFDRVTLHVWIAQLHESALSDKRFGTARVSLLLDGQCYGNAPVDRHTNQSIELDLSRVSTVSIIVDEHDNLHFWDWCIIGLQ